MALPPLSLLFALDSDRPFTSTGRDDSALDVAATDADASEAELVGIATRSAAPAD